MGPPVLESSSDLPLHEEEESAVDSKCGLTGNEDDRVVVPASPEASSEDGQGVAATATAEENVKMAPTAEENVKMAPPVADASRLATKKKGRKGGSRNLNPTFQDEEAEHGQVDDHETALFEANTVSNRWVH